MAYQLGEVIRQIRQSKKYTQKYIAGTEMSRTTYAKIEACQMQPTVSKFMHILEMLDMSYEEFFFIKNMYTLTGKEEIIHDFLQISTNVEVSCFMSLQKKCKHYLADHSDSIIEDIFSVSYALILIHTQNNYQEAHTYAERVWHRLSKLENWYTTELKLLNNIFFLFPIETSLLIARRALREIERFACINGMSSLKPAYLINMTLLLLNNGQFTKAVSYSEKAIIACRAEKRYDLIAIAYGRRGIALMNIGEKEEGEHYLQKALQICQALDLTEMETAIRQEAMNKTDAETC